MKKALQITEETQTIDGCQKLINVWQFRMRWLYFEIRKIGRYYYNVLKKIINEDTLEIEREELFNSLSEDDQNKLARLTQLISISSKLQDKITEIGRIQTKQFLNYFGEHGTTPELSHPYGGYLGKDNINECDNLELKY